MARPVKITVTTPPDNTGQAVGRDITFVGGGDSGDGAGRATSMHVRIFYRVNGVPFAHVVYNGAADHAGGNVPFASNVDRTAAFRPSALVGHSVRVIAWDHRNKPGHGTDHRSKVTRFRGSST